MISRYLMSLLIVAAFAMILAQGARWGSNNASLLFEPEKLQEVMSK